MHDNVKLSVYNLLGQTVVTLIDEPVNAGIHAVTWDTADYPSGIYFYKMRADDRSIVKRMVLLK